MSIINQLKKTFLYRKLYYPYRVKEINKINQRKREIFKKEGKNALAQFIKCMDEENISYWLEFGTLLGVYRDGTFVPNEMDLDAGVYLRDACRIYCAMMKFGFRLVREFHVVGENGLEQTYEYNGTTIDLMYFYESEGFMLCNGAVIPTKYKKGKYFEHAITSHHFQIFSCSKMLFGDMEVSVPSNVEEHLIEIYGSGFRVYDPNFKRDFNKKSYSMDEKKGIGFIIY